MRTFLLSLFISLAQVGGNGGLGGIGGTGGGHTSCSALPSSQITYQFLPASGCSTSSACLSDAIGGNNASQTTSGDLPTYGATSGANSKPALTFNGTSDFLNMATTIPSSANTYTFWVVWNTAALGAIAQTFFANTAGTGFIYFIRGSSLGYYSFVINGAVIANSTNPPTAGTWTAEVVTYNATTGAGAFYTCASGSCTSNGTFTQAETISGSIGVIGYTPGTSSYYMNAKLSELGYNNAVWSGGQISTFATWANCQYGI